MIRASDVDWIYVAIRSVWGDWNLCDDIFVQVIQSFRGFEMNVRGHVIKEEMDGMKMEMFL